MPVEESQAAMEARQYYWVTWSGWSHHHSLFLPTGQHWQLNNKEVGPSKAWQTKLHTKIYSTAIMNSCRRGAASHSPVSSSQHLVMSSRNGVMTSIATWKHQLQHAPSLQVNHLGLNQYLLFLFKEKNCQESGESFIWPLEDLFHWMGFPGGSVGKESACNEGDLGWIPGLGNDSQVVFV